MLHLQNPKLVVGGDADLFVRVCLAMEVWIVWAGQTIQNSPLNSGRN